MTLDEAIAELHRVTPSDEPWTGEDVVYDHDREPDNIDHAIAAIINAVIAGRLIPATAVQALPDGTSEVFYSTASVLRPGSFGDRAVSDGVLVSPRIPTLGQTRAFWCREIGNDEYLQDRKPKGTK